MTADSQWAVQQAIYAALRGSTAVKALIGNPARVYDYVPTDSTFPYVTIGEGTAVPGEADTKSEDGMEQTINVHTWSRERGMSETKQIMGAVIDALDQANLSIAGFSLVMLRFEFSESMMDPDGLTRHGVQRFRVVTGEA